MRRLIPLMVDTTLRHLLWMLEQWPELHLGVTLPTEAVSDVRHVALGELQGYLYYWIPRLSHEAHDLTVLDQDTPYPDGADDGAWWAVFLGLSGTQQCPAARAGPALCRSLYPWSRPR